MDGLGDGAIDEIEDERVEHRLCVKNDVRQRVELFEKFVYLLKSYGNGSVIEDTHDEELSDNDEVDYR